MRYINLEIVVGIIGELEEMKDAGGANPVQLGDLVEKLTNVVESYVMDVPEEDEPQDKKPEGETQKSD